MNVTSWTENEVNILVQAWSEVEAKYPSLRCQRGAGTLHAKIYALFSRRCSFVRSSSAVTHMKNQIRNFVLFVHKFDEERRRDGDRFWFELSVEERGQRRRLVPRRVRGLTTALCKESYAKLLEMERVRRWLGVSASAAQGGHEEEAEGHAPDTSFISSASSEASATPPGRRDHSFASPLELKTPKGDQEEEKVEYQQSTQVEQRSDSSTCSLVLSFGEDESSLTSALSPPPSSTSSSTFENLEKFTNPAQIRANLKHRDCNILLENMMELQNKKMRRAVAKLRADIQSEIQRSSEMLHSIISNQFEDPQNSGDVAFVTKVLNMQQQQIRDRFDQFVEKRTREEAENRGLLGQRYQKK